MLHSVVLISAVEQGDSAMDLALVAEVVSNSCDPMNHRPPGSSVRGILQARRLEWGATAFSSAMYTYIPS